MVKINYGIPLDEGRAWVDGEELCRRLNAMWLGAGIEAGDGEWGEAMKTSRSIAEQ